LLESDLSLNLTLISAKIFAPKRLIDLRLWQEFAERQLCRLAPALGLRNSAAIHNRRRGWSGLGAQQGLQQSFSYIK